MHKSESTTESKQRSGAELQSLFAATMYATFIVGVSALMLILNAVMCLSAHTALTLFGPTTITENPEIAPRVSQMIYFVVPVILMVLEWILLDRLFHLFSKDES